MQSRITPAKVAKAKSLKACSGSSSPIGRFPIGTPRSLMDVSDSSIAMVNDGSPSFVEIDGDVVMRDTMTGILDDVEVMRRQTVMIAGWNKGILHVSDQLQLERVAIGSRATRLRDEQETMRQQFNSCQQAHQDEMNQMRRIAEWHKDKADNSALHEQVYANAVIQLGNKAWQELYGKDLKIELLEKRSDVLNGWVSGLECHAQNVYDQAVERVRWDD